MHTLLACESKNLDHRDDPKLINIRILEYLMHYLPKLQGVEVVAEEINSCEDDNAPLSTGQKFTTTTLERA